MRHDVAKFCQSCHLSNLFDIEKDWDEGINFLLFAVRESVQESLGFNPFAMVFWHIIQRYGEKISKIVPFVVKVQNLVHILGVFI